LVQTQAASAHDESRHCEMFRIGRLRAGAGA
jgi:hypothetical protein